MTDDREPIVSPSHTINSMRSNGYKNTTYAIAELIDNSAQAGAKNIELLCYDRVIQVDKQERRTIHQIAVADDGNGMNENELKKAITVGGSTRFNDRKGIGRFGMGLPISTISQCKRLDVYTWQNGGTPIHTYLSVDQIEKGDDKVPRPSPKEIDAQWKEFSDCVKSKSGTLMVWSELDRCNWRKSETIIDKSEHMIGRIYRNLIDAQKIKITAIAFMENSHECTRRDIRVNDPGYLMRSSSTPEYLIGDSSPLRYSNEPMFDFLFEDLVKCTVNGERHEVKIKYSIAKTDARGGHDNRDGGDEPWGKHAKGNVGISLMRADRELELDTHLVNSEPTERWWGIEVSFPPALDEMFGVTNDKQSATNFARLARAIAVEQSNHEEDVDPDLVRVMGKIVNQLRDMRSRIKKQRKGARKTSRYYQESEGLATRATKKRQEEGHRGDSDADEKADPTVRKEELEKSLVEDGIMDEKDAHEAADYTIEHELKYKIVSGHHGGSTLFDVSSVKGVIIVKLNEDHPAYNNLIEVMRDVPDKEEGGGVEELKKRLQRANKGLELLLVSWARYEDEKIGEAKIQVQDLRWEWGRIAKEFLVLNT